jgi:regulator of sigma E protease
VSWLLAFLGFCALIVLHEAGHFAAAKAVGMRVERFSLFFPPLVLRWRPKGSETEYAIGAIPLGGYVKISGMTPHEELPPEVAPRAYYRQKPWKRIVVILAGPFVNLLIAFVLLFGIFATHGKAVTDNVVAAVQKDAPAAQVLKLDDRIVAVDGVRGSPDALRRQISTHACAGGAQRDGCVAATPVRLTVERGGRTVAVTVRPRFDASAGRPLVGFGFGAKIVDVGVGEAASLSVTTMWKVTRATVSAIGRLFVSSEARKQVSGVVGSYEVTRQSFLADTVQAIWVLALISLSLAVINLFPFLPLDGGHVFWALAEKIRGRPIPFAWLERASAVGFLLVAFLFAIGLTNDIGRLNGEGFGVR